MAQSLGGRVEPAPQREYGHATVRIAISSAGPIGSAEQESPMIQSGRSERTRPGGGGGGKAATAVANPAALFVDVPPEIRVWASHGDLVAAAPEGFAVVATSANAPIAGMTDASRGLYAILFHPEVVHTERGLEILRNFAYGVCGCTGDWTMASFVEEATARVKQQINGGRVVCALSDPTRQFNFSGTWQASR